MREIYKQLLLHGQAVITIKIDGKNVPIIRILNNGADWTKPFLEPIIEESKE